MSSVALKNSELLREQAFINAQWCDADSAATLTVTNPATGEALARVPSMGASETRRAIESAEAAWPAWRARPAAERAAGALACFDTGKQRRPGGIDDP